jgi:hypothetical protein
MAITVKVACPVCSARTLEYEHQKARHGESVDLTDQGCVELTAHDKGGVIREPCRSTTQMELGPMSGNGHSTSTHWSVRLDELGK